MKLLLCLFATLSAGIAVYFGFRSKESRQSDARMVSGKVIAFYNKASGAVDKLIHTEKTEEQLSQAA